MLHVLEHYFLCIFYVALKLDVPNTHKLWTLAPKTGLIYLVWVVSKVGVSTHSKLTSWAISRKGVKRKLVRNKCMYMYYAITDLGSINVVLKLL